MKYIFYCLLFIGFALNVRSQKNESLAVLNQYIRDTTAIQKLGFKEMDTTSNIMWVVAKTSQRYQKLMEKYLKLLKTKAYSAQDIDTWQKAWEYYKSIKITLLENSLPTARQDETVSIEGIMFKGRCDEIEQLLLNYLSKNLKPY